MKRDKFNNIMKYINANDISLIIPIIIYFIMALTKLEYPGLSYDEMNFANLALGINDDLFSLKLGKVPYHIMEYIGALKSYIYYFIFKIFGVSVYTIRIPLIICGGISLILIYKITKNITDNKYIAFAVTLCFATDSTYIIQHHFDLGPTVIEMFIKCFVLFLLNEYYIHGKKRMIIKINILLFLGMFNKLTFIWFINAIFAGLIVCYIYIYYVKRKNIYVSEIKKRTIIYIFTNYILCALYFFIMSKIFKVADVAENVSDPFNLNNRITYIIKGVYELIAGTIFSNAWFTPIHSKISIIFVSISVGIVVIGFISFIKDIFYERKIRENIYYIFFAIQLFTILAQVFIVSTANKPWHIYSIYPYFWIFVAINVKKIVSTKCYNKKINFILIIMVVFMFFYHMNIQNDVTYISNVGDENSTNWSRTITTPAIYDLIEYGKQNKDSNLISVDWGTHTQLMAFIRNTQYKQIESSLMSYDKNALDSIFADENNVYVTHGDKYVCFKEAQDNFFKYIEDTGLQAKLIKEMYYDNNCVYKLWKVNKKISQRANLDLPNTYDDVRYSIDILDKNNGLIQIDGWAYDENKSEKYIVLNNENRTYIYKAAIVVREDVSQYFSDDKLDYSGFTANFNDVEIEEGDYNINILIKNKNEIKYVRTEYKILI